MKKTKIIVPAMGLLLLSTAASITGTVAWFAVNTSVSITGLQVKAKAEGGIVIAPYALTNGSSISATGLYNDTFTQAVYTAPGNASFSNTATMSLSALELYPTSTANTTAWFHATSSSVNSYAAVGEYTNLNSSGTLAFDGKHYKGAGTELDPYAANGQYFLYSKYVVKATSSDTFGLWVSAISVSGETNSAAFNDSLRVAIKVGEGNVSFFAPMYAANDETTLYYYSGSARTAGTPVKGLAPNTQVADPAGPNKVTGSGVDMQIWIYYEGEDENCKTINADDLDTLTVGFTFTTINPTA